MDLNMRVLTMVLTFLVNLISCACGHGRLWEPPSRGSMWRRGYNTSVNINDNELSCGGFTVSVMTLFNIKIEILNLP